MRILSILSLLVIAASSFADCTSGVLLQTSEAILSTAMHDGVIDYSLYDERAIRRVDTTTRQTSVAFTSEFPLEVWTAKDAFLAITIRRQESDELLLVAPNGTVRYVAQSAPLRGFFIRARYLFWFESDGALAGRRCWAGRSTPSPSAC
jgi:hypothetical protein